MTKVTTPTAAAATAPANPEFSLERANTTLTMLRENIKQRQIWLYGQLHGLQLMLDAAKPAPPNPLYRAQGLIDAAGFAVDTIDEELDMLTEAQVYLSRGA